MHSTGLRCDILIKVGVTQDIYLPLYCASSCGADTFRLRLAWVELSCDPSFCFTESKAEAGRSSCPRSALFSLSSFLISFCISEKTCAKLRPLSMLPDYPSIRVQHEESSFHPLYRTSPTASFNLSPNLVPWRLCRLSPLIQLKAFRWLALWALRRCFINHRQSVEFPSLALSRMVYMEVK